MLRKLEKYEVLEELGHGGMATVYRARDTVLDRPVALKVMHPHLRGAEEARRRFHREARSVARLRHPRVLEIYDFSGESSEEAYIAAELLTGPTLKKWREEQGEVPAEIAACVAIEILRALQAAHAGGIIHRDVKPENVLLHEARELKLTDFGIADMMDAQSMTATGQILGSPGHMAPEQIEGKDCDARTDLFSVGTVLYYLATGRLPYTGRNPHQVLKRIVDGDHADPLRVNPAMGGRLRAIIVKALARDPAERFQDTQEFVAALTGFVAEAGIDDPEDALADFLQDPERFAAELRSTLITNLTARGQSAAKRREIPLALDYYNRVLALDEGNERVLRLIARVGSGQRRRLLLGVGTGLLAFGAVSTAVAWSIWPDPDPDSVALISETADVGELLDGSMVGAPDAGSDAHRSAADASDHSDRADAQQHLDAHHRVRPVGVREQVVRFTVNPSEGTLVSIDGATPRSAGAGAQEVRLSVGRHVFRFTRVEQAGDVYAGREYTVVVEAGAASNPTFNLPFRSAPLFVRCVDEVGAPVSGTVRITNLPRFGRQRCDRLFQVPMARQRANYRIEVEAEGFVHRPPAGGEFVQLEAGQDIQRLRVTLARTP